MLNMKKEWKQIKYTFDDLKNKGLIFGRKNIINALRKTIN